MARLREYDIAFVGLKPGTHEFHYEADIKFFENFGTPDFNDCNAIIDVRLEKLNSLMRLRFDIDGVAEVNCDRCGNPLKVDLWDEFEIVVKQVENPEEMNESEEDPDIFYISFTESHLHLAKWIYEFVMLSIPNQRICGVDENGHSKCNKDAIELLEAMKKRSPDSNHSLEKVLEQFKKK